MSITVGDRMSRPPCAWLFDIDGVLTDPETKMIRYQDLLFEIVWRLEQGEPVGANTGRSLQFAEERFLTPLRKLIPEPELLLDVIIIGDKGGTWLTHDALGTRHRFIDKSLGVEHRDALISALEQLVAAGYSDIAFVDKTKEVTVTIEMKDGVALTEFAAVQHKMASEIRAILRLRQLDSIFVVDETTIAIDVQHMRCGKGLGARRYISLLTDRRIEPNHFITFGDSASDLQMAEAIHATGRSVEVVFVGGDSIKGQATSLPFPVLFTEKLFDEGTLAFLRSRRAR